MHSKVQIACDTHVHCYQFDQLPQLLNSAVKNMTRLVPEAQAKVLFFTDGFVDRTWLKLQDLILESAQAEDWQFANNEQSGFIEAKKNHENEILYLAPARQVNTAGKLEMLLLGCDQELNDKQPANELINTYGDQYALISPWGVGKWLGKRGRVLVDIINHSKKPFALGDNGGRPFFWPVPHFNFINKINSNKHDQSDGGIRQAVPIINGSDPLPISGEINRVGTYGVKMEVSDLSIKNVLEQLKEMPQSVENFGKPMGIIAFAIARFKMLLR